MKPQHTPVIIFSVYQAAQPDNQNLRRHNQLLEVLKGANIAYIETLGMYKGITERSLVIDAKYESFVQRATTKTNQESYLYLDQDRNATLVMSTGEHIKLGVFKAVKDDYVGDYTQNINGGHKYAIIDNTPTVVYDIFEQVKLTR